jgi:hypothetical protein
MEVQWVGKRISCLRLLAFFTAGVLVGTLPMLCRNITGSQIMHRRKQNEKKKKRKEYLVKLTDSIFSNKRNNLDYCQKKKSRNNYLFTLNGNVSAVQAACGRLSSFGHDDISESPVSESDCSHANHS